MTTFYANTANTPPRAPRYGGVIGRAAGFVVPTGFVQATDEIIWTTIPQGATIMDMSMVNKSTGRTVDVGLEGQPDRFFSAVPDDDTLVRLVNGTNINVALVENTVVKSTFNVGDPNPGGIMTFRVFYILEA